LKPRDCEVLWSPTQGWTEWTTSESEYDLCARYARPAPTYAPQEQQPPRPAISCDGGCRWLRLTRTRGTRDTAHSHSHTTTPGPRRDHHSPAAVARRGLRPAPALSTVCPSTPFTTCIQLNNNSDTCAHKSHKFRLPRGERAIAFSLASLCSDPAINGLNAECERGADMAGRAVRFPSARGCLCTSLAKG
jgi:hypothetical protein